jgi:hypothetical protein
MAHRTITSLTVEHNTTPPFGITRLIGEWRRNGFVLDLDADQFLIAGRWAGENPKRQDTDNDADEDPSDNTAHTPLTQTYQP